MCRYRKSVFNCYHTQLAPEPLLPCSAQVEYLSGLAPTPCDIVSTHGCSTIRVPRLCEGCSAKQASLDQTFSAVKGKIAELRKHLNEVHGGCMKHIDEAGLEIEAEPKGGEDVQENLKSEGDGPKEVDPVAEFLRMKKNEKYSHLMMLGDAQPLG